MQMRHLQVGCNATKKKNEVWEQLLGLQGHLHVHLVCLDVTNLLFALTIFLTLFQSIVGGAKQ
jgi:hypothetical protein